MGAVLVGENVGKDGLSSEDADILLKPGDLTELLAEPREDCESVMEGLAGLCGLEKNPIIAVVGWRVSLLDKGI